MQLYVDQLLYGLAYLHQQGKKERGERGGGETRGGEERRAREGGGSTIILFNNMTVFFQELFIVTSKLLMSSLQNSELLNWRYVSHRRVRENGESESEKKGRESVRVRKGRRRREVAAVVILSIFRTLG